MTLTIGADIGGTKIAVGVVDETGGVVARTRRETPATDPAAIEAACVDAVSELRAAHRVAGVGVAAAGFVDAGGTTVVFAPNVAWRDQPLGSSLAAALDLPVVVENDANAAAWGEFRYGAARDVDDMVLLTVGTGLGGGVVADGRLLRGAFGMAAELGHVRMVPNGIRCGCGNRGCWEQYASGRALEREARELAASGAVVAEHLLSLAGGDPLAVTGTMVSEAAVAGDQASRELIEELGRWLGEGVAQMAAAFDPAMVVIGGGVSSNGELLLDPARVAYRRNLTARGHRPELEIRAAVLGNEAGLIGVADLARGRV